MGDGQCRQHCPFYWETSSFLRAHYQTSFHVVFLGTGLCVPVAVRKRVSVSVAGGGGTEGTGSWHCGSQAAVSSKKVLIYTSHFQERQQPFQRLDLKFGTRVFPKIRPCGDYFKTSPFCLVVGVLGGVSVKCSLTWLYFSYRIQISVSIQYLKDCEFLSYQMNYVKIFIFKPEYAMKMLVTGFITGWFQPCQPK